MNMISVNRKKMRSPMSETKNSLISKIDILEQDLKKVYEEKIELERFVQKQKKENDYLLKNIEIREKEILCLNESLKKYQSIQNNEKIFEKKMIDWYEILNDAFENNNSLKKENLKLLNRVNALMVLNDKLNTQVEDTKHHLSYTLGSAIVSTKLNFTDISKIPNKLIKSYKKYYDYKLIKKNIKTNFLEKKNELSSDFYKILPLRNVIREINLDINFFNNNNRISVYSNSSKPHSISHILCDVVVVSGNIEFKDILKVQDVSLQKGQNYSFQFSIKDSEKIDLLEFKKCSKDIKLIIKWSKKKGRALILELNQYNNKLKVDDQDIQQFIYKLPVKPATHLLWNASNIAEEYGYHAAIDYFKKYAKTRNKNTIHILKANMSHKDENVWLDEVNSYIRSYSIEGIQLNNEIKDRFFRIEVNGNLDKIYDPDLITVIMPTYNAELTIEKAVRSILNQTWYNLELIVVNDCSSDSTLKILNTINDDRLKVITNIENVGAYVSKNIGLIHANGKYITGHDSDDWAHPRRLENHINAIRANGDPRASITKMIRMDKNGYFSHIGKEGTFCTDGVLRIASITCMFEKKFLTEYLGAWDCVRMGADSEIIARAQTILGEEFKVFEQLGMICLDAEGSLTNDPVHGVSKMTGISDTRKNYRDSWLAWHQEVKKSSDLKLEFPATKRKFLVPEAIDVNFKDILRNLK